MSVFTDEEREYLLSGVRLGRLATVGSDGTPHVVPTAFRYNSDDDTIDIGGHDFSQTKGSTGTSSETPRLPSLSTTHRLGATPACARHRDQGRGWRSRTPAAPS